MTPRYQYNLLFNQDKSPAMIAMIAMIAMRNVPLPSVSNGVELNNDVLNIWDDTDKVTKKEGLKKSLINETKAAVEDCFIRKNMYLTLIYL